MAEVVLHSFEPHGRAEIIRLILNYYGVSYEERTLAEEDLVRLFGQSFAEFRALPRLDIDGLQLLDPSSIARYLCQKYGAYPADPYEVYLVETLSRLPEEVHELVQPLFSVGNIDAAAKWFSQHVRVFRTIEKRLLSNPRHKRFFVGGQVSMADFSLFEMGYDCFCRPFLREYLENLLREKAPNFHLFIHEFIDSSPTLSAYLRTRPEPEASNYT